MTVDKEVVAAAKTPTKRARRTPINGTRSILGVKGKDPNFSYRFVNDTDDRVQEFIDRGYELVTDTGVAVGDKRVAKPTQEGSNVQVSVGQGTRAFLMRIKKEWYDEDQKTKLDQVSSIENQMKADTRKDGNYGSIDIK